MSGIYLELGSAGGTGNAGDVFGELGATVLAGLTGLAIVVWGSQPALITTVIIRNRTVNVQVRRFNVVSALFVLEKSCA